MSKRKNVRVRQHVAYFRRLTWIDHSVVPPSTLEHLYRGRPHPRLIYMVGDRDLAWPPGAYVIPQDEWDELVDGARVRGAILAEELKEMAE